MGAERHLHARLEYAVHDANRGDRAAVPIVVGIKNQGAQRGLVIAFGRRDPGNHGLEQLGDASAFFC